MELYSNLLISIFASLLMWFCFYLNAVLISKERAGTAFLFLLITCSSLLCTQAFIKISWLCPSLTIVLILGACFSLIKNINHFIFQKKLQIDYLISYFIFLVLIIYAALPSYRYDQWNYHLVIAKWISMLGSLPTTVFDDHMYFSGAYEFIWLIPRQFISDDNIIHGLSNSFTVLAFSTICYDACHQIKRKLKVELKSIWFICTFILFACPHSMSLVSSKPDMLLFPCALIILGLLPTKKNYFWPYYLVYFAALPLAFKITWLVTLFLWHLFFCLIVIDIKVGIIYFQVFWEVF